MSLSATDRKDDVKLGQALLRLNEEDPSLTMIQNQRTHDTVLWGQGEMHLRVALERLKDRFGVNVKSQPPAIGYQETIRKSITQRGRHKKQSGGHGQFGDVVLEIKPMPRGAGFEFHEKVVGGAVPRNYIGAVEEGVVDSLARGPLGFPVIDIHVTLTDGSYHSVDSSDLAFRTAARVGMSEALPQCQPVLLEPIHMVEIVCPTEATAKINAILSARRGQILGFDTREGWPGWDCVRATMPEAEIGDLIVELRSATAGAGSFTRAVRPHGRSHRPRRRPDHRRASRRGVRSRLVRRVGSIGCVLRTMVIDSVRRLSRLDSHDNCETKPRAACLIGWPAAHSRSPLIHHYWLRTLGIEGGYVIEAVPPEEFAGFRAAAVAPRLRRRQRHHSAQGARAGAVEAGRARPRGRRRQYAVVSRTANCARPTPTSRALSTISTPARPAGTRPTDALVLGAGGSSRAVVFGLIERGIKRVHLANRTVGAGARAGGSIRRRASIPSHGTAIGDLLPRAGLLVNTTRSACTASPRSNSTSACCRRMPLSPIWSMCRWKRRCWRRRGRAG